MCTEFRLNKQCAQHAEIHILVHIVHVYREKKCMYIFYECMWTYRCTPQWHYLNEISIFNVIRLINSQWCQLLLMCANYLDIWANNARALTVALSRFSIFISVLFTFRSRRSTKLCKRHQFAKENKSEVSQICNKKKTHSENTQTKTCFLRTRNCDGGICIWICICICVCVNDRIEQAALWSDACV